MKSFRKEPSIEWFSHMPVVTRRRVPAKTNEP